MGTELLSFSIQSETLNSLFKDKKISLLPLNDTGLSDFSIAYNLFHHSSFFENFDTIIMDLNQAFLEDAQSVFSKSFPNPLFYIKNIKDSSHNTDFQDIILLEPLNIRRYLLKSFEENSTLIKNCLFYSSDIQNLKLSFKIDNCMDFNFDHISSPYVFFNCLSLQLASFSQNLPLGYFKDEEELLKQSLWSLLRKIKKLKSKNILTLIHPLLLAYLSRYNFDKRSLFEDNVFLLKKQKKAINYERYSVSEQSFIELSKVSGPLAEYLLFNNKDPIQSVYDVFFQSLSSVFQKAKNEYKTWTQQDVSDAQIRNTMRFAKRLAFYNNAYIPSPLDILIACQSCVDANFAFEVCKIFNNKSPFEKASLPFEEVRLSLDSFFEKTMKISFKKFQTLQKNAFFKKGLNPISMKKKSPSNNMKSLVSEEKYKDGSWLNENHPYSCSFPEEDYYLENKIAEYRKNTKEKIIQSETTVKPLGFSLESGLDIKATLKNWYKNQDIYVKQSMRAKRSDIGAVVVSFAREEEDEKYSWKSFWFAEEHDDSHLMFYATPFQDNLIGPGIAKSFFGGFAVIPIESYLTDPWRQAHISQLTTSNLETLIIAAAFSTPHKSILFIGSKPPRKSLLDFLRNSKRHVIFSYLNDFPINDIRKLRTFHVLAEAGVRHYAHKYILKDFN